MIIEITETHIWTITTILLTISAIITTLILRKWKKNYVKLTKTQKQIRKRYPHLYKKEPKK